MFTPNDKIARTAAIALSVLEKFSNKSVGDNKNEGSGKQKAISLSKKEAQSFPQMKRLKAYFENNSEKVVEERRRNGVLPQHFGKEVEMGKSNIILVWNLHGGDEAKRWVESQLSSEHGENLRTKEHIRKAGGAHSNNGMGVFKTQYDPSQQRIRK